MKKILELVGGTCIILASFGLTINAIVAFSGGGTEYSVQVSLLRGIAWGIIGIGFLQMAKNSSADKP